MSLRSLRPNARSGRAARRRRSPLVLAIPALALVDGGAVVSSPAPVAPPVAGPAPIAAIAAPADVAPVFLEIGRLARERGFGAARARLEAIADATEPARAGHSDDAAFAATYLGLLAHAHDDPALARDRLRSVPAATAQRAQPGPRALDDWRLYVLADSAAALGARDEAERALDELLARHPDSPLRPGAIVRRAELAVERGDAAAARARVVAARAERLPRERAVALEWLGWRLAVERRDAAAMRDAARRLLVLDPLEASRRRVVDELAARGGDADWRLWLSPAELVERAAALLEIELPAGALTTLAAVPPGARGFDWRLLEARALVAAGRGAESLASLASLAAPTDAAAAALEAARARSAAAAAERSRTAVERADWRRLEREYLLAVVRLAPAAAPELEAPALRRLASSYLDEERRAEAVAALRQLAALDPTDSALARPLWELGWRSYRAGGAGSARAAIAAWSDLAATYPRSSWARAGTYWSARAHERLGEREVARARYLALSAAGTPDFYARQAALRLAGAVATAAEAPAPERWPEDPTLARAQRLSDLALDGLAATELELVGGRAETRALAALSGLSAARAGDRRASLRHLKRAFPQLGTALQASAPTEAFALYYPLDYRVAIARAAAAERLEPNLIFGMVHQESGFDAAATSHAGARGLMQLMPATGNEVARKLGLSYSSARLTDPDYSLRLGTYYFRRMLDRFDGNVELALAAYNAGPGRISRLWAAQGSGAELDRFLEELALEESRNYVKRIVVLSASYRSLYPDLG